MKKHRTGKHLVQHHSNGGPDFRSIRPDHPAHPTVQAVLSDFGHNARVVQQDGLAKAIDANTHQAFLAGLTHAYALAIKRRDEYDQYAKDAKDNKNKADEDYWHGNYAGANYVAGMISEAMSSAKPQFEANPYDGTTPEPPVPLAPKFEDIFKVEV